MKKLFLYLFLLFFIKPVFAEFECKDVDYFFAYEVNTYTCEPGYFLPANALGCYPCPDGCACEGGTFKFNAFEFQGLKVNEVSTNTMNKVCSSNFPIDLYISYEPNILTLDWDYKDGTGRIEHTTCVYDTPITDLPPMPVRPGYKFMGWRVKVPE